MALNDSESDTNIGHLVLFPRVFAEGTATKSYCSCEVKNMGYTHTQELTYIKHTSNVQILLFKLYSQKRKFIST